MTTPFEQIDAGTVAARLERLPMTSYQRRLFLVIATAWFFDSVDLGVLTFLLGSIRAEFGLTLAQAGFISSVSFLGMFLGASSAGSLADKYGRKSIFQVSMLIWGLGSLVCGLSQNLEMLILGRLILGLGMGMEFPVAQAMASEIATARVRGRYIALLEGCWPLGFIAAGFLSYFALPAYGWRGVFLITAAPALFVLAIRWGIPESPRWLAARGRNQEALETLEFIEEKVKRRLKGAPLPPPNPLMAPIERSNDRPASTWRVLWSYKYAKRTTMVWTLWFLALFGYYGLTTWLSALLQEAGFTVTKSILYIAGISLAGIPGFLAASYSIETLGRKITCATTLLCAAAACYFYGTSSSFSELIAFGCMMQFFLFGMWSVLYAYTPELYPTRARASGSGWASAIGRLGSLAGPPVIGVLVPVGGTSLAFTLGAGAFSLAAIAVVALGEETKGRVLEDISQ